MFLRLKQRFLLIPGALMAVLLVVLFAPQAWRDRMTPTSENALDTSAKARLDSWAYARNLAANTPSPAAGSRHLPRNCVAGMRVREPPSWALTVFILGFWRSMAMSGWGFIWCWWRRAS